jgi:hypothetical protein
MPFRRGTGLALAASVCCAPSAGAQSSIAGTVFDSVAGKPLAGAVVTAADVQNPAATARTTTTDAVGHYVIAGVNAATYIVGFLHPVLDSLGLEPVTTRVAVSTSAAVVDLAVPSGRTVHDAICKVPSDATGALIGHLRDATSGLPVDSGRVVAQWSRITFADGGIARALPTLVVTTNVEGWFAFCGIPAQTQIAMQGTHGADSTGSLLVEVPAHGIMRRDLFTARAEVIARTPDSAQAHLPEDAMHRGTGRVTGVVHDATNGKPLGGVQLTVHGTGLTTTANDDGTFMLANLPLGTQTLLVRKVGYVPDEYPIDLLASGPAHAEPSLVTIRAMLDTVKVVGKRVTSRDPSGFARRFKAGTGRFFDADQIDKIHPFQTSDLFRRVLSVGVVSNGFDKILRMRNAMGGGCTPTVYVDGFSYRDFSASDLDNMVHPESVAGVEIYDTPGQAPPEYSDAFSNCGSIVVWTKR